MKFEYWDMKNEYPPNQTGHRFQILSSKTKQLVKMGQNMDIFLSPKNSNKMLTVWNYLGLCPCFETRFVENQNTWKKTTWNSSSM